MLGHIASKDSQTREQASQRGGQCSQPVSVLRRIWTMTLKICFNFWLALKLSGSWTR